MFIRLIDQYKNVLLNVNYISGFIVEKAQYQAGYNISADLLQGDSDRPIKSYGLGYYDTEEDANAAMEELCRIISAAAPNDVIKWNC